MNRPSATHIPKSPGGAFTRPRISRILRTAEFRTVYDTGIRVSSPLFAAFCAATKENDKPDPIRTSARMGLTTPRALGGAVVRNRLKRRFREVFRLHRSEIAARWDIVVNPRRSAIEAPFAELERAFGKVIETCKQ